MKRISTIKYGLMAIVVALAVVQTTVFAQGEAPKRSLEGVWEVTLTPRNCATGEPIPAAGFRAMFTFHKDGTLTNWYSQGTPATGHGLWRSKLGRTDYSFKLRRLLRTTTTPAVFSGTQELGGTMTLSESGDEYTSDEYMIVFDVNGVPGTPACLNSVGTRFKLEEPIGK